MRIGITRKNTTTKGQFKLGKSCRSLQLVDLPREIHYKIFEKLSVEDLQSLSKSCKGLRHAILQYKSDCQRFDVSQHKHKLKYIQKDSHNNKSIYFMVLLLLLAICLGLLGLPNWFHRIEPDRLQELNINFEYIDQINNQYPGLLSPKQIRIIKTRLQVMRNQVSVLMLLGRSKDSHCRLDPTFCIGQTIANVTQMEFGYIDASDPDIHPDEIEKELKTSLEGIRYTIMIDSLEKLPADQVMNLFQYIDRDLDSSQGKRRGMLLFVVYTGNELDLIEKARLKETEMAEKILSQKWSAHIPKDSLTSVISRMCGSIVKLF